MTLTPSWGGRDGTLRGFRTDGSVTERTLAPGTMRRILGFARPYRGKLTVFLICIALNAAAGAATPLLLKYLIDRGITPGRTDIVGYLAVAVAVIAILSGGLTIAERWLSARIGEGLILDLRRAVFDHVQRMPLAFFARTKTGALIQRINGDVLGAQQTFTSTLSSVVSNTLTVVFVLAAMLSMSWQLTLLSLALLPLFILPAKWIAPRLAAISRDSYRINADIAQLMNERFNVSGAHLTKIYGRPNEESEQFAEQATRVHDIGIKRAMYGTVLRVGLGTVAAVAVAVVYGLGGSMAIRGSLTVGVVVALATYLGQLYGPLVALSNVQVDVMTALVSFERVFEVLDLVPSVVEQPHASDLTTAVAAHGANVTFDAVTFRYPAAAEVSLASLESVATLSVDASADTLHEVSFTIPAGTMTAVVGQTGAGKTTLSQLLSRMYDPTAGAIRIAGQDLREVTFASLHDTIGVVTQDAHLFHDTIAANLRYARPDATDEDIAVALHEAQIWDLVESLPSGIDTVVGDKGYRLSGGERQRIAIARLLLKAPSVVVLDEATAHLDSASEQAVQRALAQALTGRTSLVIAHRLSTIRDAHQILVLSDGDIVARGTHTELLAAGGSYANLYRTQFTEKPTQDGLTAGL